MKINKMALIKKAKLVETSNDDYYCFTKWIYNSDNQIELTLYTKYSLDDNDEEEFIILFGDDLVLKAKDGVISEYSSLLFDESFKLNEYLEGKFNNKEIVHEKEIILK